MTEKRKNDTLKLMEEFNFKVPYTAEIFYESDDDKSPTNEIANNENNQTKDLDDILRGIIGDIAKASEKSNQIDHASSKNRRLSSESSPAKRAKANKRVDGNEVQVPETLNVEYRAENIQNDQGVSRKEAQQSSINDQTLYASKSPNDIRSPANDQYAPSNQYPSSIQSRLIMTSTTWQDTINSTGLCQVNNSYAANTRQTSESNNNEQSFYTSLSSQNSTNNSTQPLINNTRLCQVNNNYTANARQTSESNNKEQTVYSSLYSQNSTNKSTHPLISLSEMIVSQSQVDLLTKASECVGTLLSTISGHLVVIMKAWTKYTEVCKTTHIDNIVENARKLYRETKYHFFNVSLTSVINTLLPNEKDDVFIKKFIEYTLEMARSRNVNVTYQDMTTLLYELIAWAKSYRYPLLNELLHPPAQPPVHIINRSKEHQGWQCDSTNNAGYFRFRSVLPVPPINVNSSIMGTTQPVQNVNPPVQSLTYYEPLTHHRRHEPQSLANPASYVVGEFQAFTRQDNQSFCTVVSEDPKNSVGKNKRGPKAKKKQPVVSVPEVQVRTYPPPYEDRISAQRNYSENYLISTAHCDITQPENQACGANRSLSRDSGIMSPRSPANDLNYSSEVMTPLITHVTSLNPGATLIKDGSCRVCGTATKQMCLGCYKVYYCSNRCQITDWTTHVKACIPRS